MKKRFLAVVLTLAMVLSFAACGNSSNVTAKKYTQYVEAVMECSYLGEFDNYMKICDATKQESQDVYDNTMEYYAYYLMYYNDVDYEVISQATIDRFVDIAEKVYAKAKYTVNQAEKTSDSKVYHVTIEIEPTDFNDITYDPVYEYIHEVYNPQFENMSDEEYYAITDEQWVQYEEIYANAVADILEEYIDQIGYKTKKTKIVEISVDSNGNYGVDDEDWYEIDDYIVDIQ